MDTSPLFPEASTSSSSSHLRPSLFELLAQEQLRDLLHPVVRYVLSYLTQHYPRYFLRILNRHEEFFAALLFLIERHHLKKHNASLSEHFYQLRLVLTSHTPSPRSYSFENKQKRNLSRRQRWGLLLFLVGLPYIRARAQDYYERLRTSSDLTEETSISHNRPLSNLQRAFKLCYPYLNLSLDLYLLSYDISYLFEKSHFYRPWHRLLGVAIERRVPEDDLLIISTQTPPHPPGLWSNLPPLLPPLLLVLKLSQWWYSPSSPRTLSTPQSTSLSALHRLIAPPRKLPILPSSGLNSHALSSVNESASEPSKKMTDGEHHIPVEEYKISKEEYGKCPVCKRKWQNPAILPSGWVVCWRCGWDAVQGEDDEDEDVVAEVETDTNSHAEMPKTVQSEIASDKSVLNLPIGKRKRKCPITGMKVGPGQLRRVLV